MGDVFAFGSIRIVLFIYMPLYACILLTKTLRVIFEVYNIHRSELLVSDGITHIKVTQL